MRACSGARLLAAASSLAIVLLSPGVPAAQQVDVDVLFTVPADIPPGPLVVPPSPLEVVAFAGQPRMANDGTWYALYTFPVADPNDPLEFTRDSVMLRDGLPFIREGMQIPDAAGYLPAADFTQSQQPFFDVSIAGDGTVAQIARGTDDFTVLPDGTPDPATFVFDDRLDLLLVDQEVTLTQGEELDIVPGVVYPDNQIQRLATVKAASADRILVKAELSAGGTFDPETVVLFDVVDPGGPGQTEVLRFTDADNNPIPGLGFDVSSFTSNEEDVDFNASGSILLGIDIQGAPFDRDGAVVLYDAPHDVYRLIAREGDPSPLAGRVYDSLFNKPLALNDQGDTAFLASVDGDSSTDGILVVNGAVVIQEDDVVGTAVPGGLQLGFANANIEMDADGNIVWYGAWNDLKDDVCPSNPDITSSYVIFEGLFFNDQLVLEGGVTEVHDVVVDGQHFPTLVVMDLPNTGFAGFNLTPDGRWLITHALLAEPDPDVCAFSINNDATPVAQALLAVDLSDTIFHDGFESGDTAMWSVTTP